MVTVVINESSISGLVAVVQVRTTLVATDASEVVLGACAAPVAALAAINAIIKALPYESYHISDIRETNIVMPTWLSLVSAAQRCSYVVTLHKYRLCGFVPNVV